MKFLEFKNITFKKADFVQETIKAIANELANKVKVNMEQADSTNLSNTSHTIR